MSCPNCGYCPHCGRGGTPVWPPPNQWGWPLPPSPRAGTNTPTNEEQLALLRDFLEKAKLEKS